MSPLKRFVTGRDEYIPLGAETRELQIVQSLMPLVGTTSYAPVREFDLQHRSFVFATAVSGADGGVKFDV